MTIASNHRISLLMLYTMHYILSKSFFIQYCLCKKKLTQIITELLLESQMERTKFM